MEAPFIDNIVISEDTITKQEEIIKAARMTLKEVHNFHTQKENYHPHSVRMHKMGSDTTTTKGPTEPKRIKTLASKSVQTITQEEYDITAENPGIDYWKALAEERKLALEKTLDENYDLHLQVMNQRASLEQARIAIHDLGSLVETLSELVGQTHKGNESNEVDDSGIAHLNDSDSDD